MTLVMNLVMFWCGERREGGLAVEVRESARAGIGVGGIGVGGIEVGD